MAADRRELAIVADRFAEQFYRSDEYPTTIQDWFLLAMARDIPDLLNMPTNGRVLNLGAGRRHISGSIDLDLEHGWDAESDEVPYVDDCVDGIWAHGFFEHLSPEAAIRTLRSCEKVLKVGGILNIVVPHGCSVMQREDITHKSSYTEATWGNLLDNPYYETGEPWRLSVVANFIMGVKWDNLALFTQMVKR